MDNLNYKLRGKNKHWCISLLFENNYISQYNSCTLVVHYESRFYEYEWSITLYYIAIKINLL